MVSLLDAFCIIQSPGGAGNRGCFDHALRDRHAPLVFPSRPAERDRPIGTGDDLRLSGSGGLDSPGH